MLELAGFFTVWVLSDIPLKLARRALPPEQQEAVRIRDAAAWHALLPVLVGVGFLVAWVGSLSYMGSYVAAIVIPLAVSYFCLTVKTARQIRRAGAPPAYFRAFMLGTLLQVPMLALLLWLGAIR
jgi:hypothetical protein